MSIKMVIISYRAIFYADEYPASTCSHCSSVLSLGSFILCPCFSGCLGLSVQNCCEEQEDSSGCPRSDAGSVTRCRRNSETPKIGQCSSLISQYDNQRTFISIFTFSQYFCSYYAGTTANCPRHGADGKKYQTRQSQETGPRRPPCRSFRWVKVKSVSGKQYQYLMELYCITSYKYICIHNVRLNCSIYRPWYRWPWGQDPGLPGGRCHWRGQVSSTSVFYYMYLNRCGSIVCTFKYHTHL